ncbi:MAG: nuclear transport factor 2 family protein [Kofleriaceae bacterium]
MRLRALVVAAALLAACGGGGGAAPKAPTQPAIDGKQAEKEASGLVEEIYQTLGRGNKDSLFTLLDESLVVFGPRRTDALSTREDALVALGEIVDTKARKTVKLRSASLEVVPSPGGRSAWAFDVVNVDGQPHAVMAILTNSDDLWLVGAVGVARTPSDEALEAELARDAVVPPGASGAAKVDPAARGAVERFQKGLLAQQLWGDDLASRSDALVVGPTSGEVARGKKAIKKLWKRRVEDRTRAAVSGDLSAAVTEDGQIAWVSAPITRVSGDGPPLPLRAFAVFERDGAAWKMIALHESLAFAEPGAGASFKKIVPPRPAEPRPEVADAPAKQAKGTSELL